MKYPSQYRKIEDLFCFCLFAHKSKILRNWNPASCRGSSEFNKYDSINQLSISMLNKRKGLLKNIVVYGILEIITVFAPVLAIGSSGNHRPLRYNKFHRNILLNGRKDFATYLFIQKLIAVLTAHRVRSFCCRPL